MYKIYAKSNYFYIVDSTNNIYEGLTKDVRVKRLKIDSTEFTFDNVNGFSKIIPFSQIRKEDGTPYADIDSFLTFFQMNTGGSGSGSGGTTSASGGFSTVLGSSSIDGRALILAISKDETGTVTSTLYEADGTTEVTDGSIFTNAKVTVITEVSETIPLIANGQTFSDKIATGLDVNKTYIVNIVASYPNEIVKSATIIVEGGIAKINYSFQNIGSLDVPSQLVIFKIQEN